MKRDFFLKLSEGFVYDCLRWKVSQLDVPAHRRMVLEKFSGTLCLDELHLGRFTLLLATDAIADLPVAFALVSRNDEAHMRRFLGNIKRGGLLPRVVISDGSHLYPKILAQLWPQARHQLCVFHLLKDINALIVTAVRRLAHALRRRGQAGRKRKRGRPSKAQQTARGAAGPTPAGAGEVRNPQASFSWSSRRAVALTKAVRKNCAVTFEYWPELVTLWHFACEVRQLFAKEARVQTLWKRQKALLRAAKYQGVPELVAAMKLLETGKFTKAVAFVYSVAAEKVRTNNHVERANRWLRFWEKLRYKWRRRKWVLRFVLLALDRWWQRVAESAPEDPDEQRPQRTASKFAAWLCGDKGGVSPYKPREVSEREEGEERGGK